LTPPEELFSIADELSQAAKICENTIVEEPLSALKKAVKQVSASFSGSWQGYHSHVYYADLTTPPAGAHFSQEWGLKDMSMTSLGSHGDWRECHPDYINKHILDLAGQPDLSEANEASEQATKKFNKYRSEIDSIIQNGLENGSDPFLEKLLTELENLKPVTAFEVADDMSPKGQIMTRDTVVLGQGTKIPPHISFLSEVRAIENSFGICEAASDIARKAGSHLERKNKKSNASARVGTNIFIGHGQSPVWRDLKDFIQDRTKLPWDEFNRVPVAGITNIARLSEMLDAASVAFLVMTAEDEMVTGDFQPRLNVIHEAGLFQGRLGFTRAIVLLEDGCEQFSNIDGLGQIRFPKGNISAVFEEIRRVLEREGLIE
jgi:predicted nucleotide-binding protein